MTTLVPPVPASYDELIATFGDIHSFVRSDGTLSPLWEAGYIVRIALPTGVQYAFDPKVRITRITVHKLLAILATNLYAEIYNAGLWDALGAYGGGFQYRANRNNSSAISLHAFGLAWDWAPDQFPNGSPAQRDPQLVAIFAKYGFRCGQDFHGTKDPMHFSYSSGSVG